MPIDGKRERGSQHSYKCSNMLVSYGPKSDEDDGIQQTELE